MSEGKMSNSSQDTKGLIEKFKAFAVHVRTLLNQGDVEGSLNVVRDVQQHGTSWVSRYFVGGLLIDIGSTSGDAVVIEEGVEVCKGVYGELVKGGKNRTELSYNIASGYGELHQIKRKKDPAYGLFNRNAEAQTAKRWYRIALEAPPESSQAHAALLTNAGSCFDNLGRNLDALDFYDQALQIEPEFGMALANKGLALMYYADIVGEHKAMHLLEAWQLMQAGLRSGVEPQTEPFFVQALEDLQKRFSDPSVLDHPHEFEDFDILADSEFEEFYLKYCLEHRLFINFCNYCRKCDAAVGDPVHIRKMMVKMSDVDKSELLKSDPYLRLSSYLNQIKQDFVAARFLLVQSRYTGMDLNFVDKHVLLMDPLDYSEHSINIELLKSSFRGFLAVLDKVAAFVNSYLGLGIKERDVYFLGHRMWYSDKEKTQIHSAVEKTGNFSLNALFDMYLDFDRHGPCWHIWDTRNAITHRFVNVRLVEPNEDAENMTESTLVARTIELARLVRNAIIYLISFVHLEEDKKEKDAHGLWPTVDAFPLKRPWDDL